ITEMSVLRSLRSLVTGWQSHSRVAFYRFWLSPAATSGNRRSHSGLITSCPDASESLSGRIQKSNFGPELSFVSDGRNVQFGCGEHWHGLERSPNSLRIVRK